MSLYSLCCFRYEKSQTLTSTPAAHAMSLAVSYQQGQEEECEITEYDQQLDPTPAADFDVYEDADNISMISGISPIAGV